MSLTPERVRLALDQAGLSDYLTQDSIDSLLRFIPSMLQVNENLNLTKWTQDEDLLTYHLLDSAASLPLLKPLIKPSHLWMDLGTGCGFPGVVLAAAFPGLGVTLMDSVAKKTKALGDCLQKTGWNVKVLTGRAEDLGRDLRYRETWNGVTARAVADFRVVLEYGIPLLKTGGYLVNWFTEEQLKIVDKSQKALELLRCQVVKKLEYFLPGLTQKRWLVLVEKLGETSKNYPRLPGKASKDPL